MSFTNFKTITILNLVIVLFSLFSCNQHNTRWRSHFFKLAKHDSTEKKYTQTLNLHANDKYDFTITNETSTTYTIDNNRTESKNKNQIGLLYEVLKASTDTFLIRVTYRRFHVTAEANGNTEDIDADNADNSINPAEQLLGLLKNSSLLVTLDKKGHVLNIEGQKEINDKIVSAYADDPGAATQVQAQLQNMFGEKNIKENVVGAFNLLPDSAVSVDDSWNKTSSQASNPIGIDMKLITSYTLESVENNIAEISSETKINQHDATTKLTGIPVTITLKGEEEGNYKTDLTSGLPVSLLTSLILKGEVHSLKDVPLTIEQKKNIMVKKL